MLENEQIKRLLAAIALNDDKAAYKELFILLHSRLKQFSYSILKSNEESEELVSDLFIRVWEKRDKLTAIESPLLYFYTSILLLHGIFSWLMVPQIAQVLYSVLPLRMFEDQCLKVKQFIGRGFPS